MQGSDLLPAARKAQDAGRLAEAEELYGLAVRLAPNNADAHHNRGAFFDLVGRPAEAETSLRIALRLRPGFAPTRHALGLVLMGQGRFAEGWPLCDARHEIPELGLPKPTMPFPEWQGEDLSGRRLLIFGEQGLGDQIMFARFARQLADSGVDVTLFCGLPLVRLFDPLGVRVRGMSGEVEFPDPDVWVMSGSVAGRCGATPETLPRAPYLQGHGTFRGGIGVVTRGNPRHANDKNRSLPPAPAKRLLSLLSAVSLHQEDTKATDFQATADRIAELDLVITVDTAIAHLAGAMGKPVWILLPALATDWRWMRGRSDSPWYPTARLYRQAVPGDWNAVLDRIFADATAEGFTRGAL